MYFWYFVPKIHLLCCVVLCVVCYVLRVVRPSSVVVKLQIQGRMQIFEKEKMSPTATGLLNSESTKKCCRFLGSNLKIVSEKYVMLIFLAII